MYIKIILAVLRPSVHVHVLPVEFIAPVPSSLYHPLRAGNFPKIKAKFRESLDDSSFRSVSPATHTHKSAIYIAVSRNLFPPERYPQREARASISVAKGNFLLFYRANTVSNRYFYGGAVPHVGLRHASRGVYLPVHDRRNSISHFFFYLLIRFLCE